MIQKFSFQQMDLKGAWIIRPFYATDERGGLIKDYNAEVFRENGVPYELKETFYTFSRRGVIRALHFQLERPQPKLMRCISGHVYYVLADLRPDSETFGQWRAMELRGDEPLSVLAPAGFGQGYLALEDSVMSYKAAEGFYGPGDAGILYNDPALGIVWPFDRIGGEDQLILSEKDRQLMTMAQYLARVSEK